MKKIYSLVLFLLVFSVTSQTVEKRYNAWKFGLNIGAMWQTADVRSVAGVAGGFTLEKGIFENPDRFFSLAIRGRGLFGNTYGLDYSRNYNIKNNPALNGTYNKAVNYDSLGANSFIYNNYKTQISEGALELQISFNRLRERTKVILNLWGGIGITSYRANSNLLDEAGMMYDYKKVDSTGSSASIISSHKNLLDLSYESYANGSKRNNLITFSPSAGIGLGYQISPGFSVIFEYKLTFPQGINADYLDGIVGVNNDFIAKSKDYYHYAGVNLLFRLGKGKSKSKPKTTPTQTVTQVKPPVNTNSVVANPTTTLNPTPVNSNPKSLSKPIVNFINPSISPYAEKRNTTFNVSASVKNVSSRNQIQVLVNNQSINDFYFTNNQVSFPTNLIPGDNVIIITANNGVGSDAKSTIINYTGEPPIIVYTNPGNNPYNTSLSEVNVNATINNVNSNYDVIVKLNNSPLNNYSYSTLNGQFSSVLQLNPGQNILEIFAKNQFGSDTKQLVLNLSQAVNTNTGVAVRPVKVVITNPSGPNYKTSSNSHLVKATVTGVTAADQVSVNVNGQAIPFTYNSGFVSFNTNLNEGINNVVVSAKNAISSDSKTATLTYEVVRKSPPANVVIINPQPSPAITNDITYSFKAKTYYVSSNNQIEVKFNGVNTTNFSFNSANGEVELNATLTSNSDNIFEVKATNPSGSNSASAIVKQERIVIKNKVICHKKDKINFETITISENEWAAHQAHGDYEGACTVTPPLDPEITICHLNASGVQETITIKQSEWMSHQGHGDVMGPCIKNTKGTGTGTGIGIDPDVVICHVDGNGTKQTLTIKKSQLQSHLNHGDSQGACPRVVLEAEDPKIQICHQVAGASPQTLMISASEWPAHQAHGDIQGACPTNTTSSGTAPEPGLGGKISICHHANGSTQTIEIPEAAWPAHQAHGDTKGACPTSTTSSNTAPEPGLGKKIKICHIPPGNNSNPQTIEIPESAWPAHQAHGDTKGECSQQKTSTPKSGGSIKEGSNSEGTKPIPLKGGAVKEVKSEGETKEGESNQTGRPNLSGSTTEENKVNKPR